MFKKLFARPFKLKQALILAAAAPFVLSSCLNQLEELKKLNKLEYNWNPKVAIPIGNIEVKISDFLESIQEDSTLLEADPETGLIQFSYTQPLMSETAGNIFEIPAQQTGVDLTVPGSETGSEIPMLTADTLALPYNKTNQVFTTNDGEALDSLILNGGQLDVSMLTTVEASGYIWVRFEAMKKDGVPFVDTLRWSYDPDRTPTHLVEKGIALDMSGYSIDLYDENSSEQDKTNRFNIETQGELYFKAGSKIKAGDEINVDVAVNNLEFAALYGYLGSRELAASQDSIDLDGFGDFDFGNFKLADPQLKLKIENSFGLPLEIALNQFTGVSGDKQVDLTGQYVDNPTEINSPDFPTDGVVESEIALNKETSNIVEVLSIFPNKIAYQFSGNMNPKGNVGQNFVLDTSRVNLEVEAIVPLYGSISGMTHDIEMEFTELQETTEAIKEITFNLTTENHLPVDIAMQLYFVDADSVVLDSLLTPTVGGDIDYNKLLKAAEVDAEGNVITESVEENTLQLVIDKEMVEGIKDAQEIVIRLTISTGKDENGQYQAAKFTMDQNVKIHLSMRGELEKTLTYEN
jgi:hypothetical protein